MSRLSSLGAVLFAGLLLLIGGCGDDDDSGSATPSPTKATATATSGPSATGSSSPSPTEEPFEGGREPIEKPAPTVPPTAIQTSTRHAAHYDYDRVVFDFSDNNPGYRIEFVEPPIIADGSGNEVEIDGQAFLQIRFLGAQAHDESGNGTIDEREIHPNLASIIEIQNTGDFEGQVTWVIGLTQELDFRVIELSDPTRVVVDIAHP